MTKRPMRARLWALIAALAALVAVSALWIVHLRLGPRLDGFTGGPMVVFVPFFLLVATGLWLAVRAVLHGRVHWRALTVLAAAVALTLVLIVLYCGPAACFVPGPNRLLGWFVVGGAGLAALVHHLVLEATSGGSRHA